MNPDNVLATLIPLEQSLTDPALRKDQSHLEQLLAGDFHEIASSGRSLTREEIIRLLAEEVPYPIESSSFACAMVTPGVALLTYRARRSLPPDERCNLHPHAPRRHLRRGSRRPDLRR
jgi:glyoxylase I family protein